MSAGEQMAEGRKQKAGGVPEGWREKALSDVVSSAHPIVYGIVQAGPEIENGVPYIKSSDVGSEIVTKDLSRTSEEIAKKYIRAECAPGDIVFSLRGNIGELSIVPDGLKRANLTQGTARIRVGKDAYSKFVAYYLRSEDIRRVVNKVSKGSTFKEISLEHLRKLPILLPPLPEQRKIAAILSTWDDSLATLTNLLAAKRQQKRGLAEALLTGKKRLPGFAGEWEEKKLGDVLFEPKQDAEKEPHKIELLTVKLHVKGIEKSGKFPAKTKAARPYYKRFEGEILIGRQNFHNGGVGIVKPEQSGLIASNAISSYLVKGDDLEFVFYSISREIFYSAVDDLIGGTGQKEISRSEFARLRIPVPPLPEQQAIASILSTLDGEIASLERLRGKVQEQKRGLMDELLTGRIRVKVEG